MPSVRGIISVCMFQDLMQVEIGSSRREDIALTVLASIIGRNEDENRVLIDAGALALSKDRSTQATSHDAGYGEVWDIAGRPSYGSCVVKRVYQEHARHNEGWRPDHGVVRPGTQ